MNAPDRLLHAFAASIEDEAPPARAQAALALYAKVLGASSLESAAQQLIAALVVDFAFTRASIAWQRDGRSRLLGVSGLDLAHADSELSQRLLGALDETIEQGVSLTWPAAEPSHVERVPWIRVGQQSLQRLAGGAVATLPLGGAGEVFGALCVERDAGPAFDAGELQRLEQLLALLGPVMRWMEHGTERWHRRAVRDLVGSLDALREPGRRTTRRMLVVVGLGLAFAALAPLDYEIGGRARVEGAEQRALVAPAEGFVKKAHVRPGDRVKAGDPLVDLVDGDLRLERERWTSQLAQHENAYAAAMAKSDRVLASTSSARVAEAQAQIALVDEQLIRGRITAPFDGVVIQGDLSQSIGAPVRQGDPLMTLATTGSHRVIVEVDEVDIARVHAGQHGRLMLSSLPWDHEDVTVERIAPLARAVEGRNVFEVEARLTSRPSELLRPGLLGRAALTVGRMPPLWAWSRHAVERLRVSWWAWLG